MPTLPPIPQDTWDDHVTAQTDAAVQDGYSAIDQAKQAQDAARQAEQIATAREQEESYQSAQTQLQSVLAPARDAQATAIGTQQAQDQLDSILGPARAAQQQAQQGTIPSPGQLDVRGAPSTASGGPGSPSVDVGSTDWRAYAAQAAQKAGIDPGLFTRQIDTESHFNPNAVSPAGAKGIAQIVPEAHPNVDPMNPAAALDYAATWMRSLIDRYGGDVRKALAAYNAGPGAVDKYGGVPPFEETQRYVRTIADAPADTSPLGPPPTPGQESSQFARARSGSPVEAVGQFEQGLPYEEAAAICGPVAALAFAQSQGRNPDLAEARSLAKQVGWTSTGGMNGVANEQALLTRLGVKSRLDTNPDFGHIAADASSGNPVIISTPVHYYYASGYDPTTGKVFVGKTGTSRRGGGSWMTPQEIATLDGGINGALFVDNPQSPTPSVGVDPMASGEGDRPASEFETPPPEEIPRRLGPASIDPTDLSRIGIDVPVPGPSEIRAGALTGANAVGAGIDWAGQGLVDNIQKFSADQEELARLSLDRARAAHRGETLPPDQEQRLADLSSQYGLALTGEPLAKVGGEAASAGRSLVGPALSAAGLLGGGAAGYATSPAQRPDESDAAYAARVIAQTAAGGAAGLAGAVGVQALAGRRGAVPAGPSPAERAQMPAVDQILKQWDPGAQRAGTGLAQKLEEARTFLVRKMTDRRVDVNQAQAEVQRLYGRDLPPDMQLSELSRMNPTGAATLRAQNDVAPAIRAAGDDLPYVDALLAARGNVDMAVAKNNQARAFPGGATAASSADVPAQLAQTLGPQRFKVISDAADQIVKVNRDLRQMLVDSGRITQETADEWATKYPNYTPTQIVDYLAEQSGVPMGGQGKSLGVRGGAIHTASVGGSERGRLMPIASTINNIYTVENLAKQQATFNALRNWVERVPEMANRFQVVDGAYSGTRAESAVKGYVDGQLKSIVTPFPEMARVLRQEPTQTVPIIGPMMQAVKELITARNPAFLVGNAMMDFPVYLIRETAKAGGMPQDTARAIGRYAAAIPDAFAGLLSGEFRGPATQRYLAQGGSMEAWAQHVRSPADAERYVQELRRSGGIHVSSVGDLMAASKALLTGQTFKTIGERVELVPRVAAFRAGEEAGLSPARAVTRGRDVTVDFAEGGTWAKTLNQLIPFFNPAVQGGANLARTVYQNPRGAGMTFALGLVAPTLAVEAWNRSDPERSAAYDDVPNYVKDRGIVFMLPGPGGQGVLTTQDAQGNRKPQYLALNLREFAPVVDATRAAGDVAFGREHRSWSDLLLGAAQQVAPTADVGSATPLGARSLLELGVNKDLYRGTAIATQNADERASILSKALAQGINDVAAKAGLYPNARPSQAEFLQRENLGVLAQASGGVSDVLTGATRGSTNPQDLPVAGAFLRRVVGNATGQGLENAREGRLDPDVRKTLYDTGLAADVTTVPRDIKGITLLQADQTAYQTRANQHVNEALRRVLDDPKFASLPPDVKKRVVSNVVQGAKQVAAGETLAALGADEVRRRAATAKKAG